MATANEIADLRILINETSNAEPFTDLRLSDTLDGVGGDQSAAAALCWRQKAASYADLVNVKEGQSQRDLGALYKQAMEMAKSFEANGSTALLASRPRTRAIIRPT